MARVRKGRGIDGILILNKPLGVSSNHALQSVKRLYFAQKAGHTGSLDPLATGVLPICLGEATKFTQYLLNADKSYKTTIRLGELTATGDAEGAVIAKSDASNITQEQFITAMNSFLGDIEQIPPMYSALKVAGQPLYKLAREGKVIERAARSVIIKNIELIDYRTGINPEADIYVECSKGTYIRSLGVDIGSALSVGAHLTRLHRVAVGGFNEQMSITIPQLQLLSAEENYSVLDDLLIPTEETVNHLPLVEVSSSSGYYVRLGQVILMPNSLIEGLVRIREENGDFIGIGEISADGRLAPRRLIVKKEF